MAEKQILNFEAETKQILNLMVHSIYTHKEIFLRELISNASDALDKARFESITKSDKYTGMDNLRIKIEIDEQNRILTIKDNGIGMTKEDVIQNIGSIARSGTKAFLEKIKQEAENKKESGIDLIGQFGVGFYSAFMVADNIIIETKNVESDKGVKWESSGDGSYSIEDIDKADRGTNIILKLKPKNENEENEEDYSNRYTLERLIQKYSNYVHYPIIMDMPIPKKDEKEIQQYEEKTINSMISIWQKNKSDVKTEEYNEFYKEHFHDYAEPFDIIHTKAEGTLEYTALLFIPSKAPFNFLHPDFERGLELYSKNVFIMDKCKELIPEYLKFVRGLVDSQDFSLNISREILQHTNQLKRIASNIEKKILETLENILKNDRKKYEEFFKEFGESIKIGIYSDFTKKEKLSNLLLFQSSETAENEYTTLAEYKARMKEGQEFIYYAAGKDKSSIEKLPHMEGMKDKGFEVLYFTDRVDEFMVGMMRDYEEIKLHSILQADNEKTDKDSSKEENKEVKDILKAVKEILGDNKVADVRESDRLKESLVCLVNKEDSISFNMAKVLAETGNNMFGMKAERVLEINTSHEVFKAMEKEYQTNKKSDLFKEYSELLYDEACILENLPLEDTKLFASRMSKLMLKL
ncbi:molecular chaperone HtpG [Brachyspira aalborgi]|jgi:molecular chaperone HtpG|uniref:Chaperone protein HtpG n=1 Tax=Brachyspira aalborgi TaxID=29522 RepID=A0AB38PYF1_9SPIR|nr:molecular chaperone HtpG [Brachyspira aalborgi]TXJ25444.1 molecular chaperone HtpG [Brachyspira aalborgi]TXJ31631.1 molecular chaperone HtpG [Brachyspira aalborgi]TXJ41109.1 molecular chaperone HtpG [Brachyspira aalborgi]TXJ47408.1 molecular chaperone HtpG [Brachyspira aalborgi]